MSGSEQSHPDYAEGAAAFGSCRTFSDGGSFAEKTRPGMYFSWMMLKYCAQFAIDSELSTKPAFSFVSHFSIVLPLCFRYMSVRTLSRVCATSSNTSFFLPAPPPTHQVGVFLFFTVFFGSSVSSRPLQFFLHQLVRSLELQRASSSSRAHIIVFQVRFSCFRLEWLLSSFRFEKY